MESIPQTQVPADLSRYKPKWQERFAFFEQNGGPRDPRFKQAFKALSLGKRLLINMNWIAFFFGPIYLFVLGLWKKNLALLGISLLVGIVLGFYEGFTGTELPRAVDTGVNCGLAALWATVTNYAYYLKEVKGQQGWNPFEK
ncbi:DUF2628 domain-containing protein [Pseudomonas xantholysinigenes]|uniref:DUF2628 domain-containing protein n=1 Tax=Pseudomonas xantholysinigenes TaxID=2745490 RepID=A0A9E6PZX8_9PSED|nr:DUF2628 domain-containing protein [Pseudomonas xantholysinigenes]QXI39993.1 DUF2628 domain-containing protein [Pseudomonas xantholysinigenes]